MPIAIAPSFISNTIENSAYIVDVTSLSNDGFLVRWYQNGDTASDSGIRGRLYSAAGVALAPEFLFENNDQFGNPFPLSITALTGGKFATFWTSGNTELDVRGQLYNANGTPAASDFVVNSTRADQQFRPDATTLADGSFVVIYSSDESAGAGENVDVRARHFSSNGVALGPDSIVNSTTAFKQSALNVTALTGGGYVVTWLSEPSTFGLEFRARAFNAAGSAIGADFVLDTAGVSSLEFSGITPLADGRFVVNWIQINPGSSRTVKGKILNSDGTPASGDFTLGNATSLEGARNGVVTTLADGRLLFTWVSGDFESTIHARMCTDKGVVIGEVFELATAEEFLGSHSVTSLANGRVVVSWDDFDNFTGNGDITTIESTIVNPLIYTGTAGADTWIGGKLNDAITGLGGNDTLSGGLGNDVIDGGANSDTINGDGGNDRLRGGLFNDTVNGGTGIDTAQFDDHFGPFSGGWDINLLTGKAITKTSFGVLGIQPETDTLTSIESVIGSAGTDTIQANQSLVLNNIILALVRPLMDGGGGNDTLILAPTITSATSVLGKVADDVVTFTGLNQGLVTTATTIKIGIGLAAQIVGATGYLDFKNIETLDTGQGNDKVTGSGFKDTVKLGIGNDTAILGNGDDIAFGGAGLDTLTGGDGNDSLFGEADVDTISGGNGLDNIMGGVGADKLSGGLNADKFFYVNTADGTDIITDFAVDDFFAFKGTVFGTLPVGALAATRFWTNTTGLAHDADDRFIFNTTDDTLWYDSNGNAAGGAFKMADMNIAFNLTAADILVV